MDLPGAHRNGRTIWKIFIKFNLSAEMHGSYINEVVATFGLITVDIFCGGIHYKDRCMDYGQYSSANNI